MMRTALVAMVAVVAFNCVQSAEVSSELLASPSFAFLDTRGHLAYLSAKSYATKNHGAKHVEAAGARCDEIRRSAHKTCATNFCGCQEGSDCSSLDLSVFLETEPFALRAGQDKCAPAKIHANCYKVVSNAYEQCRDDFLKHQERPSVAELLQVKDVKTFMKLAGQFSLDKHMHVFDTDNLQTALLAVKAKMANATAEPNGPEPSEEEKAVEEVSDGQKLFRDMNDAEMHVTNDEQTVAHMAAPDFTKSQTMRDLESAVAKCHELQVMTEEHCADEVCHYHEVCGTADDTTECHKQQHSWDLEKKSQEKHFKLERQMAVIAENHKENMEKHGGEVREKAQAAHEQWMNSADKRAADEAENSEIQEKATHTVNQWFDDDKWHLNKDNLYHAAVNHGSRRLLKLDVDDPNAHLLYGADEIAKLKKHKAEADAAAKAQKDLLASPRCVGMVNAAFSNCSLLTAKAYDICTKLLNEADEDFMNNVASAKHAEEAAEEAAYAAHHNHTTVVPATTAAADEAATTEAATPASSNVTATADPAEVSPAAAQEIASEEPQPVGEAAQTDAVVADEVKVYASDVATGNALKTVHEDGEAGTTDYAATTAAATAAEAQAATSVEDASTTAGDDVKDSAAEVDTTTDAAAAGVDASVPPADAVVPEH